MKQSEQGYVPEETSVLAFAESIEQDVAPPTLILRLEEGQSVAGMTVSPDGKQLAFSLFEDNKDDQGNLATYGRRIKANLRSVPTSGGGMSQLTTGQWIDTQPAYGKDGYIYFSSDRIRRGALDIFRVGADRASGVAIVRQTSDGLNVGPSPTKDGTVVYTYYPSARDRTVQEQIWALQTSGYPTQLREGTHSSASPDGKEIAYVGSDGQLWVVAMGAQNPTQLTTTKILKNDRGESMRKAFPSWSPDGNYIIYSAADGKDEDAFPHYDIWLISKRGGNAVQLTTNGSLDYYPVVSPDSSYIYFLSNRGYKDGIWRIPYPKQLPN